MSVDPFATALDAVDLHAAAFAIAKSSPPGLGRLIREMARHAIETGVSFADFSAALASLRIGSGDRAERPPVTANADDLTFFDADAARAHIRRRRRHQRAVRTAFPPRAQPSSVPLRRIESDPPDDEGSR